LPLTAAFIICVGGRRAEAFYEITLLESNRSFFQTAECALVSILLHLGLLWYGVTASEAGGNCRSMKGRRECSSCSRPIGYTSARQMETFHWGKLGSDLVEGNTLTSPDEGFAPPNG
jgi:hypothetical protein